MIKKKKREVKVTYRQVFQSLSLDIPKKLPTSTKLRKNPKKIKISNTEETKSIYSAKSKKKLQEASISKFSNGSKGLVKHPVLKTMKHSFNFSLIKKNHPFQKDNLQKILDDNRITSKREISPKKTIEKTNVNTLSRNTLFENINNRMNTSTTPYSIKAALKDAYTPISKNKTDADTTQNQNNDNNKEKRLSKPIRINRHSNNNMSFNYKDTDAEKNHTNSYILDNNNSFIQQNINQTLTDRSILTENLDVVFPDIKTKNIIISNKPKTSYIINNTKTLSMSKSDIAKKDRLDDSIDLNKDKSKLYQIRNSLIDQNNKSSYRNPLSKLRARATSNSIKNHRIFYKKNGLNEKIIFSTFDSPSVPKDDYYDNDKAYNNPKNKIQQKNLEPRPNISYKINKDKNVTKIPRRYNIDTKNSQAWYNNYDSKQKMDKIFGGILNNKNHLTKTEVDKRVCKDDTKNNCEPYQIEVLNHNTEAFNIQSYSGSQSFSSGRSIIQNKELDITYIYYLDYVRKAFASKKKNNKIYNSFKDNFSELFDTIKYCKSYVPKDVKELVPKTISYKAVEHDGRTLFLDLDETLIHTEYQNAPTNDNTELTVCGQKAYIKIHVRPYMYEFQDQLKEHYNLCIFTASQQSYAKHILQKIDPYGEYFDKILTRENCLKAKNGTQIKDLRVVDEIDLDKSLIVDNTSYMLINQLNNGIPIIPFYDNYNDIQQHYLLKYLKKLLEFDSIVEANSKYFQYNKLFQANNIYHAYDLLFE